MALALEMYLDAQSDRDIRTIWAELAESGISSVMRDGGYRPHVSLGVAEGGAVAALAAGLAAFAAAAPPLELLLANIGVFPGSEGVVYLGAVVTLPLLEVHAAAQRLLAQHAAGLWAYYVPGRWVPHCTMAFLLPPERISAAVDACRRAPLPMTAGVAAAGLVDVSPQHYAELAVYPWGPAGTG